MEYVVGTQYRFKNNDFGNPEIITPEVSRHVPIKERHKLYIPGTHVIFCLIESTIQILEIRKVMTS